MIKSKHISGLWESHITDHMGIFQTFRDTWTKLSGNDLNKSLPILKWESEFDNDQEDPGRSHISLCDQHNSKRIYHDLSWSKARHRTGHRYIIRLEWNHWLIFANPGELKEETGEMYNIFPGQVIWTLSISPMSYDLDMVIRISKRSLSFSTSYYSNPPFLILCPALPFHKRHLHF